MTLLTNGFGGRAAPLLKCHRASANMSHLPNLLSYHLNRGEFQFGKMKRNWEYIRPKILIVLILIIDHLAYDRRSYAMSTCQEGGVEMVDRHPVLTLVGASECSECSDKHIQSYLIL